MLLQDMLKTYNQQAAALFASNASRPWAINKEVALENEAGLFYSDEGFFTDCALEAPIGNATINPLYSLANMIPVFPTNDRKVSYGFLTSIDGITGDYPDAVCDPSPTVGDPSFCKAEFELGRISFQTKTLELDALLEKAHRGVREDFYLVGQVRGQSAIPTMEQLRDADFVRRAAVRRQLMLVVREFQRELIRLFWTGDPTNGATNTAGRGRAEFWGMSHLIADDYDDKDFVSGADCEALNSDVKTFGATVGSGEKSLFAYMQEMEDTLYQRAALMGLLPYESVIAMHPTTWSQVVKYLPCEMMGDSCVRPGYDPEISSGNTIVIGPSNDMSQVFLRNQMMNTMMIELNGRSYRVVLDHGIPLVKTTNPVTYTGSIYFVPLRVAGEVTLFWRHKDYRTASVQLSPLPGSATDMLGWSDSGRYHWVVEHVRRCFLVDGKVEPALTFTAPHLAGRIDGVTVSPLQSKPEWYSAGGGENPLIVS